MISDNVTSSIWLIRFLSQNNIALAVSEITGNTLKTTQYSLEKINGFCYHTYQCRDLIHGPRVSLSINAPNNRQGQIIQCMVKCSFYLGSHQYTDWNRKAQISTGPNLMERTLRLWLSSQGGEKNDVISDYREIPVLRIVFMILIYRKRNLLYLYNSKC